jgi:hypothetical protein
LMAGAYVAARNLAVEGADRHPKHAELKKMAYILAPPKVVRSGPADPGVKANWEWFKAHGGQYRGRWVALHNGDLITVADSFDELVEQVNDSKEARILITKVY